MTTIDCKAIFNFQRQILKSTVLTAEQKIQMIVEAINETLGEEKQDEKAN